MSMAFINILGRIFGPRKTPRRPASRLRPGVELLENRLCLSGDLLVLSFNTNSVLDYNGASGAFQKTFASGAGLQGPSGITLGPDDNVYVSSRDNSAVLRFDGSTGAFLDDFVTPGLGGLDGPHGLVFHDGSLLVNSGFNGQVVSYDGATGAFQDPIVPAGSGGLQFPHGLAIGPDDNIYVGDRNTNSVLRYDGHTGAFLGTFVTAGSGGLNITTDLTFGPEGNLYVSSFGSNAVLRYDGHTGAFQGVFASSGGLSGAQGLTFGPDGNLYVSSMNTDQVLRYDGHTGAFLGVFASGGGLSGPTYLLFQHTDTTTTVSAPPGSANPGQPVTFTATVGSANPGDVPPTGTVTFQVDGVTQAKVSLANGQATFTAASLSAGSHTVTAVYHGDANFNPSTAQGVTEQVNKFGTTTSIAANRSSSAPGQAVTFTATVATGIGETGTPLGTPTGSVTFFIDGVAQPSVTLVNGQATLTTSTLSVGTHTITAVYNGDDNCAASDSGSVQEVVAKPMHHQHRHHHHHPKKGHKGGQGLNHDHAHGHH
jgi:outer membrane protein assembly factor BamB